MTHTNQKHLEDLALGLARLVADSPLLQASPEVRRAVATVRSYMRPADRQIVDRLLDLTQTLGHVLDPSR